MSAPEALTRVIERVCSYILWPPYRVRIRRELTDHLLARAAQIAAAQGIPFERALTLAITRLGDPDALGQALRHSGCGGKRFACTMFILIVCAALGGCAYYFLTHSPPTS